MRHTRRGSILLATMLLAIVVAMLCGSYLSLALLEKRLAAQTFKLNAATDLAEAGVEEALWALANKSVDTTNGWTVTNNTDATKVIYGSGSLVDLGGANQGGVRVRIDAYAGTLPTITSEGFVKHAYVPTVSKQIRVKVKASNDQFSGLLVKNQVIFNGAPIIDSYDSSKGVYQGNPGLANYNRTDAGAVISLDGSISINDAKIWGRVGVGGSSASLVNAPMNGGYLKNSATTGSTTFDTQAITTGVKMTWPSTPAVPQMANTGGSTFTITANASNTIGTATSSAPQYYYYTDNGGTLSLTGTTVLNVDGPVVLVIQRGLNISNSAQIKLSSNSKTKLEIYMSENANIGGTGGIFNPSPEASKLTIYGCGSGGQNFAMGGSLPITGVFSGPGWNVNLNNSIVWNGAILAAYVNFSSNNAFHFDSALGGSGSGIKILSWQVLQEPSNSSTSYARDARTPFNGSF